MRPCLPESLSIYLAPEGSSPIISLTPQLFLLFGDETKFFFIWTGCVVTRKEAANKKLGGSTSLHRRESYRIYYSIGLAAASQYKKICMHGARAFLYRGRIP